MTVDGVRIFDSGDACFSYSHENGQRDADPRTGIEQGDQMLEPRWHLCRDESPTFDASYAHQQNWGTLPLSYANPSPCVICLGDHVDYDAATKTLLMRAPRRPQNILAHPRLDAGRLPRLQAPTDTPTPLIPASWQLCAGWFPVTLCAMEIMEPTIYCKPAGAPCPLGIRRR